MSHPPCSAPSFAAALAQASARASRQTTYAGPDARARAGARLADLDIGAAPDRSQVAGVYARMSEFARAYASMACETPAATPTPDAAALRRAIAAARRDARRLRALRRAIARATHPDRGGDAALMAELNALIDAALPARR